MKKMHFSPKEATLPKISQHRLTLLRSSNSWKKFLTLPSITVYAFIQIHSLTLSSPKPAMPLPLSAFWAGNAIPNFSSGDDPLSLNHTTLVSVKV